jgi:hypothetical protein
MGRSRSYEHYTRIIRGLCGGWGAVRDWWS